ncbi:MAG: hypothetical protein CI949_1789, partial [Halanaerobium sp.]
FHYLSPLKFNRFLLIYNIILIIEFANLKLKRLAFSKSLCYNKEMEDGEVLWIHFLIM